ncbi:pyridoxal phosphate-dependent decarboxylase family protein [Aquimarina sp. 2201CG14-23]|uniref:pyridoxal phosphate-dependent decarboxylase family protein n=1 Tax=Aquimarina mycalae TaxID=3040073 RepID=UPI00247807AC|nr:aminotransferase class V-fold PLP-dependent enzyme [Aquimarina sp. 2201CG14-23]MDH7445968.1 aminotransferase class V-fold PLP-dependent enzyme [Aquimarina sp. 2201CG14-23]
MDIKKQMLDELNRKEIFNQARDYAFEYIDKINDCDVYPSRENLEELKVLKEDLQNESFSASKILSLLHEIGTLGTVAHTGGRYFGFIIGGATPISLATKWLTDIWDQCGGLYVSSPINAELEVICEKWIKDLLKLPKETVAGFVSGASMANFSAIIAARYHILKNLGWDVNKKGLNGAPKVRIVTHQQIHASIRKNLVLAGFGDENIEYVPSDEQGKLIVNELPELDKSCIVFLQAGNANSGSFDDFDTICTIANKANAWTHIDGAFGLWAATSKELSYLTKGIEKADSWVLDAHKTLNVPYDSGIVLCKHANSLANALQANGEYIIYSKGKRDPMLYTPEMSKRSRAFELWATLKYLGKNGIDEMIFTFHQQSKRLATELKNIGFTILNEVVFNQILVYLDNDSKTNAVLEYLQNSKELWLGGSTWNGSSVIRISISSWRTDESDISRTVELFKKAKEACA